MDSKILKEEFEYYIKNQNNFVEKYEGKFIVLKNKTVIGSYDSQLEAYEKTKEEHELGTFLIQFVEKGKENYTQTFYSRVSI
ncbi:MAG TPA: DUF5678 domain-containing protein [Candidatus Pacearchaeota archaeon]|nr:DUF5678 domain-containing protein [Candidatus Pacearchaeota archaeon]HPR79914.1 DUF5678 domain-containing protein [Candidatus Pacearchaeota archaeon]